MNQFLTRIFSVIRQSLNGSNDEISTARTQSYLVLAPILMMVGVVIGIEIFSLAHAIYASKVYVLSNEFIITFGMVLSHHLAVLFSRNKSQSLAEIKEGPKKSEEIVEGSQEEGK